MFYTLCNKKTDKNLIHPQVGLWYTDNLLEAQGMLIACKEYLKAIAYTELEPFLAIRNAETGEEISAQH